MNVEMVERLAEAMATDAGWSWGFLRGEGDRRDCKTFWRKAAASALTAIEKAGLEIKPKHVSHLAAVCKHCGTMGADHGPHCPNQI